jgi:hypothetical protein
VAEIYKEWSRLPSPGGAGCIKKESTISQLAGGASFEGKSVKGSL